MTRPPKISVLVSVRRNSKYLAKFMFGYLERTHNLKDTNIHVMLNEHDDWNNELEGYFSDQLDTITFYRENLQLGRAGLHEYFNAMVDKADGDWFIYFCEDHFIVMDGWDNYIRDQASDLNPKDVWCLIPKFDNAGAMNQVLSKGYVKALGGKIGRHGWIDSYLNDVNKAIPDRVKRLDLEMFHDFTHDQPSPMSEAHSQAINTDKAKRLPEYDSYRNNARIAEDQEKLIKRIKGETKNEL